MELLRDTRHGLQGIVPERPDDSLAVDLVRPAGAGLLTEAIVFQVIVEALPDVIDCRPGALHQGGDLGGTVSRAEQNRDFAPPGFHVVR